MWVHIMKTLLLTGATGFLGGAVLEKLLKENQAINYLLLVRADNAPVSYTHMTLPTKLEV